MTDQPKQSSTKGESRHPFLEEDAPIPSEVHAPQEYGYELRLENAAGSAHSSKLRLEVMTSPSKPCPIDRESRPPLVGKQKSVTVDGRSK